MTYGSSEEPADTGGAGFVAPEGSPPPVHPGPTSGWGATPPGYGGDRPNPYPDYPPQQYPAQHPGQFRPVAPKPGVIPLRPLVLGELLDGTFQVMRRQPKSVFVPALIVALITALLNVGMAAIYAVTVFRPGFANGNSMNTTEVASSIAGAAYFGLTVLVTLIGTTLVTGLLVTVTSNAALGRATAVGSAWEATKPRLGRLIGWSFLLIAAQVVVAIVMITPVIALVALVSPWFLLLLFLVLPLWIVAALWLVGRLSFVPAIIVLEDDRISGAVTRARTLTAGTFWRVLGILLLGYILQGVVQGILSTPFAMIGAGIGAFFGMSSPGEISPLGFLAQTSVQSIGQILASTIALPFMAILTTLLYLDVRMRREGLDVALAQQSGNNPPPRGW